MNVVFGFLPVILLLAFLFLLDSFNLVRVKTLFFCFLWGTFCAVSCYFFNTYIASWFAIDYRFLSHYVAPVIEELMKAMILFYLISKKKIGFTIDAAIYGFAVGAGFSLIENIYFLFNMTSDYNLLVWIIRGLGTGIMHGGCTSFFAVLLVGGVNRSENLFISFLPALLFAIVLHSGFNHFPLNPVLQTLLIIILLPIIFALVFKFSNARLQKWLEIEFNSEVEILGMIHKGVFGTTKAGQYLESLKGKFSPEVIVDMYCYIGLYLELSIKAKRNLMLKENDFPIIVEDDLSAKLLELAHMRKQIGKVGEMALSPLIRMSYRNFWKLNQFQL